LIDSVNFSVVRQIRLEGCIVYSVISEHRDR
jgi:hypothetical protein